MSPITELRFTGGDHDGAASGHARKGGGLQQGYTGRGQAEISPRFGEPEEIADVIAFAVSPPARWMTGTVLRMDGGEVKSA
jgi:NAD(P)-dependent dehydrogenase (short-subunit alcohol dehydrogenase family)